MSLKYIKPASLTWWGAVVPVIAGLIVATVDLHHQFSIVNAINGITGGLPPAVMINSGLVAIGFRGAIQ